jgi:hypothetical protein
MSEVPKLCNVPPPPHKGMGGAGGPLGGTSCLYEGHIYFE